MADVLIVCVREDEPQAKALAEMFEAAGFTIGGAPSNDAALRSSGAGVVVWSQASIRSRPFLDAAQRVINANKAIVASLIEPPPPSSIGSSLAFDLSQWDGDPNDPSLDPLFFAVDRMVNSARVGAPARQEEYEPPAPPPRAPAPAPRVQAPPVVAERPVYRAPAPQPAPADPLATETEHWRTIRDSRDPSDFMDYLSRFGPQGAFAEVAELRLKQLTAERQPQRPVAAPAPMPAPRAEAPPRREAAPPPQRRPEPPPQRRAEAAPPPQRRAEPPRRMPPPERDYADLRDPPRNQGGPVRAFILIGLLGAAALAGGLYFGGGMGNQGASAPQEQTVGDTSLDAPSDTPLPTEAADEQDFASNEADRAADQAAAREEAARERDRERERERQRRERELAAASAEPVPPPTTNVVAEPPRSGPVSLQPGSTPASTTPGTTVQGAGPIGPSLSPAVSTPTRPTTEPASATRQPPGTVSWTQRPTARRIADLYPQRALREGTGGRVTLDCVVQPSLSASCTVASESPAGEGFGRAALAASSAYRASPTLSNGQSSVGTSTRISVAFQAPN